MTEHCAHCGSRLCNHRNCPECRPCDHCDGGDRADKYFGRDEEGDEQTSGYLDGREEW